MYVSVYVVCSLTGARLRFEQRRNKTQTNDVHLRSLRCTDITFHVSRNYPAVAGKRQATLLERNTQVNFVRQRNAGKKKREEQSSQHIEKRTYRDKDNSSEMRKSQRKKRQKKKKKKWWACRSNYWEKNWTLTDRSVRDVNETSNYVAHLVSVTK